ncbi:hypothetical protein CCH79_00020992 [Gambusia affinis]|uniref:Uncharacterized protein n=1 Tax=Gambusia affinis TaxID=33528 RepID=A0A315VL56_GAMAF|nr:hypothetical protein CCH79_00020992 [Gambusia affinis]
MDPSSSGTMQRIQSEKSILDEPDSPIEYTILSSKGRYRPVSVSIEAALLRFFPVIHFLFKSEDIKHALRMSGPFTVR